MTFDISHSFTPLLHTHILYVSVALQFQFFRRSISDIFRIQVVSSARIRSPVTSYGSMTFFHVIHENLYLVAATTMNVNAAVVFEFLYKVIGLGKGYFGKFNEESVKNNFCLFYELFDEILDFGYPQNTELDTLRLYITTESVRDSKAVVSAIDFQMGAAILTLPLL